MVQLEGIKKFANSERRLPRSTSLRAGSVQGSTRSDGLHATALITGLRNLAARQRATVVRTAVDVDSTVLACRAGEIRLHATRRINSRIS